jgi:hypothetical protein
MDLPSVGTVGAAFPRLNVSLTRLDQQGISVLGAAALAEQPAAVQQRGRRRKGVGL